MGAYVFKYSDDHGRTWSNDRFEIPMRKMRIDRENEHAGEVMFFWGVGKPIVWKRSAYSDLPKLAGGAIPARWSNRRAAFSEAITFWPSVIRRESVGICCLMAMKVFARPKVLFRMRPIQSL